jgi:hypothetical protein
LRRPFLEVVYAAERASGVREGTGRKGEEEEGIEAPGIEASSKTGERFASSS